jgi:hypothetical protein
MLVEALAQFRRAGRSRGFSGGHGNIDRRQRVLVQAKGLSGEAFDAIACDRGSEGARRDAQAQPGTGFMIGEHAKGKKRIRELFSAPFHFSKFGRLVQTLARLEGQFADRALGGALYGQSFLRPLARRRASNARPLLVAMRARKPWVRTRCKLLGLKVRFMARLGAKI